MPVSGAPRSCPFRLELLRAGSQPADRPSRSPPSRTAWPRTCPDTRHVRNEPGLPAQLGKVSLPLSGFRLRSHINSKKVWDEFLVFQGASYFRAVAKNLLYGLSARGLAINTAEPSGEEFPVFTHFWIERPAPRPKSIVIYALLESESTTGAYRFTVQPGVETLTDVELTLFPRTEMRVVGIAPLTSMFLFDETNRGRLDDYRPEVHDSDGLQIEPEVRRTHISAARESDQAAGVELHHAGSRRDSDWCSGPGSKAISRISTRSTSAGRAPGSSPKGDWGRGSASSWWRFRRAARAMTISWLSGVLRKPLTPGHPAHFAYRIVWCAEPALPKSLGKVVATRSGASLDGKRRVFCWISSAPARKSTACASTWAPPPAESRTPR